MTSPSNMVTVIEKLGPEEPEWNDQMRGIFVALVKERRTIWDTRYSVVKEEVIERFRDIAKTLVFKDPRINEWALLEKWCWMMEIFVRALKPPTDFNWRYNGAMQFLRETQSAGHHFLQSLSPVRLQELTTLYTVEPGELRAVSNLQKSYGRRHNTLMGMFQSEMDRYSRVVTSFYMIRPVPVLLSQPRPTLPAATTATTNINDRQAPADPNQTVRSVLGSLYRRNYRATPSRVVNGAVVDATTLAADAATTDAASDSSAVANADVTTAVDAAATSTGFSRLFVSTKNDMRKEAPSMTVADVVAGPKFKDALRTCSVLDTTRDEARSSKETTSMVEVNIKIEEGEPAPEESPKKSSEPPEMATSRRRGRPSRLAKIVAQANLMEDADDSDSKEGLRKDSVKTRGSTAAARFSPTPAPVTRRKSRSVRLSEASEKKSSFATSSTSASSVTATTSTNVEQKANDVTILDEEEDEERAKLARDVKKVEQRALVAVSSHQLEEVGFTNDMHAEMVCMLSKYASLWYERLTQTGTLHIEDHIFKVFVEEFRSRILRFMSRTFVANLNWKHIKQAAEYLVAKFYVEDEDHGDQSTWPFYKNLLFLTPRITETLMALDKMHKSQGKASVFGEYLPSYLNCAMQITSFVAATSPSQSIPPTELAMLLAQIATSSNASASALRLDNKDAMQSIITNLIVEKSSNGGATSSAVPLSSTAATSSSSSSASSSASSASANGSPSPMASSSDAAATNDAMAQSISTVAHAQNLPQSKRVYAKNLRSAIAAELEAPLKRRKTIVSPPQRQPPVKENNIRAPTWTPPKEEVIVVQTQAQSKTRTVKDEILERVAPAVKSLATATAIVSSKPNADKQLNQLVRGLSPRLLVLNGNNVATRPSSAGQSSAVPHSMHPWIKANVDANGPETVVVAAQTSSNVPKVPIALPDDKHYLIGRLTETISRETSSKNEILGAEFYQELQRLLSLYQFRCLRGNSSEAGMSSGAK